MELRHVASPGRALRPRSKLRWPQLALLLAALLFGLILSPPARAATQAITPTDAGPAGNPVLVSSPSRPPSGFRLTAQRVLQIARADPRVRAVIRQYPHSVPYEYTRVYPTWQVSWFSRGHKPRELVQVYVDDHLGRVAQIWTGYQVNWSMARGYPGAFGRRSNALYVWLPLCLLFIAPFLPWRLMRRRRSVPAGAHSRPHRGFTLLHVDLLVLLGFSISLALFNHAQIGLSVPLVYPCLLYLLVRMLLLAFGRGRPCQPLAVAVPISWLMLGTVFLIGLRVGLDILNSNVIDVGYAGVIGADKLIHGHLLYGLWPHDNAYGDTYGPVTYLAYVPFRLIFGWSGRWDALPAAHAAAICFDLLTVAGLYLLGRRIRGHELGVILMYAWVAYPFTLFTLCSNTNDALVSATVVLCLLLIRSPAGRGAAGAIAGLTKFAPLALAPIFLRGTGRRPTEREAAIVIVAFAAAVFLILQPVLLNGDLGYFWHDSVLYQARRLTPFSLWGLWGGLGWLQHILEGAAVASAILFAFVPRRRTVVEVAALCAVVLIALQLVANYWLYPYIVWFFPLVIVALFAAHPKRTWRSPVDLEVGPEQVDQSSVEPVPLG